MRDVEELIESANNTLFLSFVAGSRQLCPLFSGGHDSLCATYLASQYPDFDGRVYHIDTSIGARGTRQFVESVCKQYGWELVVLKSSISYEDIVRDIGFPGPGRHQYVYNRLKDRCIRQITKGKRKRSLVTGCRSAESVRRMGHVEQIKVGYIVKSGKNKGQRRERNRVWTAVCHDWTDAEQRHFMHEMGLPVNPLKVALGMSMECGCGCFAAAGEREAINKHAPDVGEEIDRLAVVAKTCGKPCEWGQRPREKVVVSKTGPMCSSCDRRSAGIGIQIVNER